MIKIAVCDDEKIFVNIVLEFLEQYKKEINSDVIVKDYSNGFDLLDDVEEFDLILLDVEMPKLDGFAVAKEIRLREVDCEIVFLTSSKERGYKGYEVRAKDYLIKPVKYSILSEIITKEIEDIKKKKSEIIIFSIDGSRLKAINISDLLYIEAKDRKCIVKCIKEEFEITEKLKDVRVKLEKYSISSSHRSYLINNWKIRDYNIEEVVMKDGSVIPMSRLKYKAFRENYYEFLSDMLK